jgi:autotransporter-associated beta strand protein
MRRKWVGWVGCAPVLFGATAVGLGATLPENSLYTSSNWSGYFASAPSGEAFSDISSTWVIPSIEAPSSGTTYSAAWIGFDGVTDSTVEQCGTLSYISAHGSATNFAWYEFYPAGLVDITSLTVHPGDTMNAEITYETSESSSGNYAYYFDLSDQTTGGSYTNTLFTSSNDARSSAEWIDEAPTVNGKQSTLANFGSVTFSNDLAALDGGGDQALGALSYNEIEMVQSSKVVALPSSLNPGGDAFTVYYGSGPPNLTWDNAGGASPSDGTTWDISDNHNWNNGSAATVYTDGSNVTFNDSNNGHYAVTLNAVVNPASVTVNNSNGNYTISGTGAIAGTGSLTKSGSGSLTLKTVNTYTGATIVNAGSLVVGVSGALPNNNSLTINGSAVVTLAPGIGATTLSTVTLASSATLDVTSNDLFINYGSSDPISTIIGYLDSGYAGGTWTGPGISSSIAAANAAYSLGFADSAAPGNPAGLSPGQIEIKYTLYGDENLDGAVNSSDFGIFAANFGSSGKVWDQGDFNYDGTVNSVDFGMLAGNFGKSASGGAVAVSSADWAALDAFASANGLVVAVPEPAMLGMLAVGSLALLSRRRVLQLATLSQAIEGGLG